MFFWLYAIIELLAVFLDSGIIPTASVVYPVSVSLHARTIPDHLRMQWFAAAYTGLVAAAYACLLINGFVGFQFAEDGTPTSLWVNIIFFLVKYSCSLHLHTKAAAYILSVCFWYLILRGHRHFQGIRRLRFQASIGPLGHLHPLARDLHLNLHRFATHPRLSHPRRPVADWRYHLWDGILHYRPGTSLCIQRHDLQCDQALHRRVVLLYALHAPERHDGIQILGQYHGKPHNQQCVMNQLNLWCFT
jgi:Chitin synthase export chaperone